MNVIFCQSPRLGARRVLSVVEGNLNVSGIRGGVVIIKANVSNLITTSLLGTTKRSIAILRTAREINNEVFAVERPFVSKVCLSIKTVHVPRARPLILRCVGGFHLGMGRFQGAAPRSLVFTGNVGVGHAGCRRGPSVLHCPITPRRGKGATRRLLEVTVGPMTSFVGRGPTRG